MKQVTPPSQHWAVRLDDEQGPVVMKYDTGGQAAPSTERIPENCVAVGVKDGDALDSMEIDKDRSPWYSEIDDGRYAFIGLN